MRHPDPTSEQQGILSAAATGDGVTIVAAAGSGKTTTLRMIAEQADPRRRGLYLAYNRAIADDAAASFPRGTLCKTAHALAYRTYGSRFRDRLNGPRVPASQAARILRINEAHKVGDRLLQPDQVARLAQEAVQRFCFSADPEVMPHHVPVVTGLETGPEKRAVREIVHPYAVRAWEDLRAVGGQLKFTHDCQPTGTLVRVLKRAGGHNRHSGEAWLTEWADIPIEQVRRGDKVVTWTNRTGNGNSRLGSLRKTGREVTQAGSRPYDGRLITITTPAGRASSYTPEHICIALVGAAMRGKWVVYVMRKDDRYRVGRVQWAYGSQGNTLGIVCRARSQKPDAVWVLSAHDSDTEAALAEALVQHQFGIPGWQFTSQNERMPLARFWDKVGENTGAARTCLAAHGRDIAHPLWEPQNDGLIRWNQRPIPIRACNLMDGMLVCEADGAAVSSRNVHATGGWSDAWQPASLTYSWYTGTVHSLEVDEDHTYIADGIVTHNCYLKIWGLSRPRLPFDFVLYDEAQDANPVVLDVVLRQDAQLIAVGDPSQAIYGWRGAVDAMSQFAGRRLYLSKSFRFGPAIADEANKWLDILNAELRVEGYDRVPSVLRDLDRPDAILCRTNAKAIEQVMAGIDAGRRVALTGGGDGMIRLAQAAIDLKAGIGTGHPELFAFANWAEVQDHAEHDAAGADLKVFVSLIDKHGPDMIIDTLRRLTRDESRADVVISTAHKAKGREWGSVQVASDFREPKPTEDGERGEVTAEDAMLAYVTVTRAKDELDRSGVAWVDRYLPGALPGAA